MYVFIVIYVFVLLYAISKTRSNESIYLLENNSHHRKAVSV